MPYNTLVTFSSGNTLAAADLNNNFANSDYLRYMVNAQFILLASAMYPRVTSPAAYSGTVEMTSFPRNYQFMDFADGSITAAQIAHPLPADYNGGTVTAKFYWTANSSSSNSVYWSLAGNAFADNETLDVTGGTAQSVTDAHNATAYKLNISSSTSAITISGTPAAGELVNWQILRDPTQAGDTLAATARLLAVVIDYTRS